MLNRLDQAWRIFATAFCFSCFGLGGLFLRFVIFPLLSLLSRKPQTRARWARRLIRWNMFLFVRLMILVRVMDLEVQGLERLRGQGLLILPNHPSLIDVVILMSMVDNADCVVKADLWRNPFTRGPVTAANYVANDGGPGAMLASIASLQGGAVIPPFLVGSKSRG